ncbi:MAG: hypothetical protein HNEKOMLI_00410 [Sodalis sp. Psp]|nr:hypothetical protein [Sodalis sp. Psp]MCR3756888.1 hypothetical protein [Sodalis sp. Ppy]
MVRVAIYYIKFGLQKAKQVFMETDFYNFYKINLL